ncbi:MAG: hypothetical protein GXO47_04920 [Chlorobi bacterium]|nr:hypothetical protein [Chlorobiota bacterium]
MKPGLDKILSDTVFRPSDGLEYMREKLFNYLVLITIIVGTIALLMSVYGSVKEHDYVLLAVDLAGYFLMLIVTLWHKILSLKKRIVAFVLLPLILGISFLLIVGPEGAGVMYLVAFNMLAAVFFGIRGTVFSIITTMIVLVVLTILIFMGCMQDMAINLYGTRQFILVGINVLLISSISFVLSLIVDNLDKTVRHKERLRKFLHENIIRLAEAKTKAEESDKLKTSFLANMSHEIRTPMNAVLGFSDLILNQPEITVDEAKYYVKTIYDSGQYLMNIIENILDVSLLDTKQLKIYEREVSLQKVFEDLEMLYTPVIKEYENVELIFERNDNDLTIVTDEQRLKQVLINLINNALKFTKKGEVRVGFNVHKDEVEFYVKDTGDGISKKDQRKIFDRFVKANRNDIISGVKGAGLGLSISKGIVEMLGGKIHVKSKKGEGSVFYFTLPRNKK